MNRILIWSRSVVFLFLAVGAFGQSVETVNGVRLVHNGKEGLWGKKPKVQVELVRTVGDVAAEDETVAFYMPAGMALDSRGNLYILDTGNHRVQKFSPEGKYIASFGRQGQGPGDFSYPDSIDIDGEDMVWVSDPNNQRIQVLTPEGAERKTLSFVKERVGEIRRTKSGLVMAGGGGVFFGDPGMEEKKPALPKLFKKLDLNGQVAGEYGEPFDFEHPLREKEPWSHDLVENSNRPPASPGSCQPDVAGGLGGFGEDCSDSGVFKVSSSARDQHSAPGRCRVGSGSLWRRGGNNSWCGRGPLGVRQNGS